MKISVNAELILETIYVRITSNVEAECQGSKRYSYVAEFMCLAALFRQTAMQTK
jgi:hypothetical protein